MGTGTLPVLCCRCAVLCCAVRFEVVSFKRHGPVLFLGFWILSPCGSLGAVGSLVGVAEVVGFVFVVFVDVSPLLDGSLQGRGTAFLGAFVQFSRYLVRFALCLGYQRLVAVLGF